MWSSAALALRGCVEQDAFQSEYCFCQVHSQLYGIILLSVSHNYFSQELIIGCNPTLLSECCYRPKMVNHFFMWYVLYLKMMTVLCSVQLS